MNFKYWFSNLCRTKEIILGESHINNRKTESIALHGIEGYTPPYNKEVVELMISNHRLEMIAAKHVAINALTERLTPTREDFEAQLELLIDSIVAVGETRRLNLGSESLVQSIVNDSYTTELAKLYFLTYDNVGKSSEEALNKVNAYIKEIRNNESRN